MALALSSIVMVPVKAPVWVGAPVNVMLLPLVTGVKPGGSLLKVVTWKGLVPLLIGMAPVKPDWLTVHCLTVKLPMVGEKQRWRC